MARWYLVTGALAVVLAACSSSPSATPSTAAPGTVTPTTVTPTTIAPTTAPSTEPGTTAPSSAQPPTTPPAAASTTGPPASGPGGAAAYLAGSGYTFTEAEATCLDEEAGPEANAALAAALEDGAEPSEAAGIALIHALAACEPASYLDSQVEAVQSQSTVSDEEALCVVRVVNDLVVDQPEMASLAAAGTSTSDWPAAEKERLRAVVATCVSPAQADAIIEA
jgi:hypothetical protein